MPRPAKLWWHTQKKRWACRHQNKLHLFTQDKEESQREFHKLKAKGQPRSDPEEVTVAEVLDRYLDHLQANRSSRTYQWTKDNYDQFTREAFDVSRLAEELTAHELTAWADLHKTTSEDRKTRKWSSWTRRQKLTSVQSAFTWAVKTRLIHANPVAWVEKPPKTKRETLATSDQMAKILDTDTDFRDLVYFVRATGCRPQEASMIEARHFDGKTIYLGVIKKRKRTIYPPDELIPMIAIRCSRYPTGPIFRNTRGKPWSRDAIGVRFRRMRDELGDNITIYTLRHTYVTEALRQGTPVQTVAQLAGHSPQTTLSIYSHLDNEMFKEDMRDAANIIADGDKRRVSPSSAESPKSPPRKTARKRQRRSDGT